MNNTYIWARVDNVQSATWNTPKVCHIRTPLNSVNSVKFVTCRTHEVRSACTCQPRNLQVYYYSTFMYRQTGLKLLSHYNIYWYSLHLNWLNIYQRLICNENVYYIRTLRHMREKEVNDYDIGGQAHDVNRFSKHYTKTQYINDSNPITHNHMD